MKFIVSSTYLLKQLQVLGGIVSSSNTMPILDHFLFVLDGHKLAVSASDLDTTMGSLLEIDGEGEGRITVPARLLLDTLKTFPEQPLTFTVGATTVEISSSHGKYVLACTNGLTFPKPIAIENPSKTIVVGKVLATAIEKTLFATGNDELKPAMGGVFFQFSEKGLAFVATDAHKLVKYARRDLTASQEAEFIMPKKPLTLLKNILVGSESAVKIEYNESNAKFSFDNSELICQLVDSKYPNYETVIPKEHPNKLLVSRISFLNAVNRVRIFSNKTTHQMRLKIAGAELNISAEDIDYSNKAEERLTCDYQGDDMEIGFNSRFLYEMLSHLNCEYVQLEMSSPRRAGILTPMDGLDNGESITMLVMPVMLNPL